MDKEVHEAFYGNYNRIFCTCTSIVYQDSPQGEGPGMRLVKGSMSGVRVV